MNSPSFVADSIRLTLGGRQILQHAYIDALPGRITALVGRSGAGKTTLFKVMVGHRRPDGGQVCWAGTRISHPRLSELAKRGLFYHPDRPWLARQLTLTEHLALLPEHSSNRALVELGVQEWADQETGALSEGQLRLSEIAFGLAMNPTVALLDEPFRGLDPNHRELIATALRGLANEGVAVLYADHDIAWVQRTADRLYSMENGATRLLEGFGQRPVWEWYHEWARGDPQH